MMVNIRNKGASAEREVINIFLGSLKLIEDSLRKKGINCPKYHENVQRNSLQSFKGGHDVHGLPYISVEIKRHETLQINAWWSQCVKQANQVGLIPVLIYRQSRREWRVISWVLLTDNQENNHWLRAEYSFKDFMLWYEKMYTKFLMELINV